MCLEEGPGQLELVAVAPLARGTAVSLVQVAVLVHRQPEWSVHITLNIFGAVSRYFPAPVVDVCGRVCEAGAVVVEGVDGWVVLGVERGAPGLGGVVPPQEGEAVHVQLASPGLVPEVTNNFDIQKYFCYVVTSPSRRRCRPSLQQRCR